MEISRRKFLLLLLAAPSYEVFACTGGNTASLKPYSDKKFRFPSIGTSAEDFLNKTYGEKIWQYEKNLFLITPTNAENPRNIPIKTGIEGDAVSADYIDLTIYGEEYISIGKQTHTIGTSVYLEEIRRETRVFEVAKFRFYQGVYPYAYTRLNLSGVSLVRIFCVYTTNKKEWVRVIWNPKPMNTNDEPCTFTYYEIIS